MKCIGERCCRHINLFYDQDVQIVQLIIELKHSFKMIHSLGPLLIFSGHWASFNVFLLRYVT